MNYLYRRADGSTFEWSQPMSEEPLKICPESGQPVQRVITGGAGTTIPGHMKAPGSKKTLNRDDLPTTLSDYRKKIIKPEYQ